MNTLAVAADGLSAKGGGIVSLIALVWLLSYKRRGGGRG
jgi:hypothetical protein